MSTRVYAPGALHMTPTSQPGTSFVSTPRPIPNSHSAVPSNASVYASYAPRPSPPKVNLAEEEDAGDYRPGGYHPSFAAPGFTYGSPRPRLAAVHIMDTIGRYLILRKMGWGHFSTVWLAKDTRHGRHVALKIMKSSRRYTETALDEIKLLRAVQSANPSHQGYDYVVSFLDSFEHPGLHGQPHVCMTFEPLGENLLSLTQRCVKENKLAAAALAKQNRTNLTPSGRKTAATFASLIDLAVPPALVKCIAKQILLGMDYLHSECKLIHTDLKPENVLVALEDVEEVVRMELEMFPTSESIKASALTHITFPPSHLPRPTSPSSLHHSGAMSNQVYIFSSQPLSSPSRTPIGSLSNSPLERLSMRMTALGLESPTPTPAPPPAAAPATSQATLPKPANIPPPNSMEVGIGAATIAPSSAVATAMLSGSPGITAAALMASARTGTSKSQGVSPNGLNTQPATPSMLKEEVDIGDDMDEAAMASMSSSLNTMDTTFSQPVTPTVEIDGVSLTLTSPNTSADGRPDSTNAGLKPLFNGVPTIIKTADGMTCGGNGTCERELSICDDRTETDTVIGDAPSARDTTPCPPSNSTAQPANGPSLLSQTAPKGELTPGPQKPPIRIKIADLGNATPISHHFTNDIQTRQYRSPEAILGMDTWDERVDLWSVACVVFELLTGEYLFNPKSRQGCWGKDDDHIAQIIELVGDGFSKEMKTSGKWSREIWRSNGALRHINRLHNWPMSDVMKDKYDYKPEDAKLFADFMEPMLKVDWHARTSAKDMLDHPWLSS
ncbi:serine/threonine protein kinase, CMGC group [Tulasnella sp. 427]|nr:serine/threonine protein kinase, CMGC group [Tulasnella sp. 427]